MSKIILLEEAATPTTPSAGKWAIYTKAGGLYYLDDAGIEIGPLSSGPTKASAAEVATGTDDEKFVTALSNVPAFNNSMARQAIINGNFDVWQRGTSFNLGSTTVYTADRWFSARSSGVTGMSVSRQTVVTTELTGSNYCLRSQRVNGNSGTQSVLISQSLESVNSKPFIGKKLTLSFWARKGADFSATSNILNSTIATGTGTDENVLVTYTGSATAATQDNTLTTSWKKFTLTTTNVVATTVNEISLYFYFAPTGTASTNDYFEIAQVQLCAGDVALPFMPKSYEEELRACKRYCQSIWASADNGVIATTGICQSTTTAAVFISLSQEMRIIPVAESLTVTDFSVTDFIGYDIACTNLVITTGTSTLSVYLVATVAGGLTAYRVAMLISSAANKKLILSAEL